MAQTDFIGRGFSFPVGVDSRGRLSMTQGPQDIEEAMQMILLTPRGQRVMRPEFGCQIHELVFAPNDATTWGLASYYVGEALGRWEPRIKVKKVDVMPYESMTEALLIQIQYEIRTTLEQRSLVFPFYRIPGDDEQP